MGSREGLQVGGAGPQRDLDLDLLAVPEQVDRDRLARGELGQDRVERVLGVDRLAVDRGDDVALLDAGLGRRAVRDDRVARLADAGLTAVDVGALVDRAA